MKLAFYFAASATCIFWAEVVSANIPWALAHPFMYPAYGFLVALFFDSLMRWNTTDFRIMYLYGSLVGFITETYLAKVIFYGLDPAAFRFMGFSPAAVILVILFYHSWFSFLAPAYFFRRVMGAPLPIRTSRLRDAAFVFVPFLMAAMISPVLAERGLNVVVYLMSASVSIVILAAAALVLKFRGRIENVLLTASERKRLINYTIAAYVLFLFFATNKAHGHPPTDIPLAPLAAVSALIYFILYSIRKIAASGREEITAIPYDGASVSLTLLFAWLIWHFGVIAVGASVFMPLLAVSKTALIPVALAAGALGIGCFAVSFTWIAYRFLRG